MSQVYSLLTPGPVSVDVDLVKTHLKIDDDADDDLLNLLVRVASDFAEKYTGRDTRPNTWRLLIDAFEERICLRRSPVDAITSVKHLVSGSQVTVPSTVYYLKKGVQRSEILLLEDQSWPTDTDNREQAIEIDFTTVAHEALEQIRLGIIRHVAHLYENRGDCDDTALSARASGATAVYDQVRIARV